VTVSGIITDVIPLIENALLLIVVIPVPITKLVKFVVNPQKNPPIDVTLFGIINSVN
jgi:hypothetical protein